MVVRAAGGGAARATSAALRLPSVGLLTRPLSQPVQCSKKRCPTVECSISMQLSAAPGSAVQHALQQQLSAAAVEANFY